jgi:hypothetical protein
MWPFSKKEEPFWEYRFQALADYNSEVGRGIMHEKNYRKAMEKLQCEYEAKMREWAKKNGHQIL